MCKSLEEIEAELDKRIKENLEQDLIYQQLTNSEQREYNRIKIIIDQRKPAAKELVIAYIILAIRKQEDENYIQEVATAYQQDYNKILEQVNKKYRLRKD